jgi:hypothetical protein
VALEPAVRPLEVRLLDVELLPVLLEDVHAPGVPDPVGDPRANEVAEHPGRGGRGQAVLAVRDVEPGEQHRRLARHGDAGALEQHQHEHPRKAERVHRVDRELDDRIS